jgi:hypothetical protein
VETELAGPSLGKVRETIRFGRGRVTGRAIEPVPAPSGRRAPRHAASATRAHCRVCEGSRSDW